MEPSDWTDIGFAFTLRCWQDRAIKRLLHQIEAGAGIHPVLADPTAAVIAQVDAIHQHMRQHIASSARPASQWAVGQDSLDPQQWTVERPAYGSLSAAVVRERNATHPSYRAGKTALV